ncbi:DUF4082 domain-containing protein [Bradyrhizobium sp. SYSU BS000235]|uniref:DUF4082 domain-containing protein n=1 Tax=Bradyrhizobium sp. SYSU BS000235 TaxID=3411332 RepID=UPI003C729FB7
MGIATTADTSSNSNSAIEDWAEQWRSQAQDTICGSCNGGACYICSIRVGGEGKADGTPTGYVPRALQLYKPEEQSVSSTNNFGTASFALDAVNPALIPNAVTGPGSSFAAAAVPNAIVLENMKQGTPESEWLIDKGDPSIEGYAAQFTIDHGQRVDFKINTDSTHYKIEIYRLGYYGGDGARLVKTIEQNLSTAQVQPVPLFDPTLKLVDAGNWSVSASWDIPADAVSGVYIAKLTRLDGGGDEGGENMIPFIVRDDEAPSDITFQTSDTTWQAYNWWGGYNFYGGIDDDKRTGRSSAVSYNRPIITRDGGFAAGPQDFIFGAEYPAIRWLEENGYDVNYISGIDTARDGAQLLNSQVFLSVGHDEYWSADQRANVEAARDAGVNLAFLSGNEVYWQTRWESSIDGTGTPYKTLVSYKERWDNANSDVDGTTSTWRDPEFGSGQPENALTGTIFTVDGYVLDTIQIPYDLSNFRFWSNTAVADIQPGQVYSLVPNLLGYEWDSDLDNGSRPDGLIALSSTTADVSTLLLDYGNTTGNGTATHSLTLYRAPSGALVFGAGTVYWVWGLDDHHDNEVTPTDPNVQQAMVNLFAEMGVQPQTLMTSLLVASQTTDHAAPTSTITSPTSSTGNLTAMDPIIISGTATDAGGGLIAVVEVSTDGGTTWHRATGFANWTYTWTPLAGGTYTILSRAVDDSVNLETPGVGRTVTVDSLPTASLFSSSETPAVGSVVDSFVNVGVKFSSSQSGTILGIKFYKGLGDGGTHVGALWSSSGTLLASATFQNETDSGWQTVTFSNPISIAAGVSYMASYRSSGHYATTDDYFVMAKTNGPLTAPADNGYYTYGVDTLFPTTESNGANYWVDVIFSPTNTANEQPVATNDDGYIATRNTPLTFLASTLLANDSDPNGDLLTITGVGSAVGGTVSFDAQTNIVTFVPTSGYTGTASFGYAVSDGRGGIGSAFVHLTVVPPSTSVSLFSLSDTPEQPSVVDDPANLGVRFVASAGGTISGIKFYKAAGETGTHVGSLWSSTGALLATATFANESASGWQTVTFSSPVAITAGTTYIASYHSNGRYAVDGGYFNTDHVSGSLTASAGDNGLYTYSAGNAFPTSSFGGSNYWVDVLFNPVLGANDAPDANDDGDYSVTRNMALIISGSTLLANDTDPNNDTLTITGVSNAVNGTVSFNAQSNSITFTPNAGYTGTASFDYAISDGREGTATATVGLIVSAPITSVGLFSSQDIPDNPSVTDSAVNLGMRFVSSAAGTISGVRFYKAAGETGTHTGSLWSSNGTLLANATFVNETASGWQTVTFSSPVSITAGTSYIVSYHSNGRYAADSDYFSTAHVNGALTAPASNNGLYTYGTGNALPASTYSGSNYWVDVLFDPTVVTDQPVANNDNGFVATTGSAFTISASTLLGNDTDPQSAALSISGVSNATNGTVSYNAGTQTVTYTPNAGYSGNATFSYAISNGQGGTASANVGLLVNDPSIASLFGPSYVPPMAHVEDPDSVEVGMKFQASADGDVLGVRFYKSADNMGSHVANLWSSTGTLLATANFTNETQSGWQQVNFANAVAITAGDTYTVSYHTTGGYAADPNYFTDPHSNGPLTAPANSSGGNGVFAYGGSSLLPTNSFGSTNYGVDVLFRAQLAA